MRATVKFDGASRGNPGPAAAACVMWLENQPATPIERTKYLPRATNNEAEYEALAMALETAHLFGVDEAQFIGDSKLVVEQVLGAWAIKEARLKLLASRCVELAGKFPRPPEILHVARFYNREPDALVTKLLDQRTGKKRK